MCSKALLSCIALAAAGRARAAGTVDAPATTLLAGHQEPRDGQLHTVVPAYELLTVSGRHLESPYLDDVNIIMTGWGKAAAGDPMDGRHADADVSLGYL